MKALDFSIKYSKSVRDFFSRCCENEEIPIYMINEITVCFNENGYELRLETNNADYNQQINVEDNKLTPLYLGLF